MQLWRKTISVRAPRSILARGCARTVVLATILLLHLGTTTLAGWFNTTWPYRRPVELIWDDQRAVGDEVAMIAFYTGGHHKPNGEDIRVALPDGELVPSRAIMTGPGDQVRVLFAPVKTQRKYYAYFGGDKLDPLPPKLRDWKPGRGLLLEMRAFGGGPTENPRAMEQTFEKAQPVLGRTMIDRPFLGSNPFGEQEATISKLSGSFFVPQEGEYVFAMAVDDQASLWLDGKPVLFARIGPNDSRQNTKVNLNRGPHPFLLHHVNHSGPGWFTVAWKTPQMSNFDVLPRDAFGFVIRGNAGALEMNDKVLIADFTPDYQAECFFADRYAHRVQFTANVPKTTTPPKFEWDFGDGQKASGQKVDHVFLTEGIFPVRLTVRLGANADVQTDRVQVSRDYENIGNPANEEPPVQSKLVEGYDLPALSPAALTAATWLHLRANRINAALDAADQLVQVKTHSDAKDTQAVMRELTKTALNAGKIDPILKIWQKVPDGSDLRGAQGRIEGQILLWWKADFDAAVKLLAQRQDAYGRRLYGQALILSGKPAEGKTVLESLPAEEAPEKQVAVSGAMARTTEYFITEGDVETGEETWEKWQQRYPSDFLEGYSTLLRVKLIEKRNQPKPAAKVAEAFASAFPTNSYAPALLDQASRLLEKSDPPKSKALRELLKTKYPEDPLSNR